MGRGFALNILPDLAAEMLAVGKFMIIVSCIILFDTAEKASTQPRGGLSSLQFKHIFLLGGLV
jgi:hypothetical protein